MASPSSQVEQDKVDARIREMGHEPERIERAEMDFERQPSQWPQRGDRPRRKPEVGHEVAVEHVEVDEVETGGVEPGDLVRETTVVAVEERRPEPDGARRPCA